MVKVKRDLTGESFGRWKVLKQVEDKITSANKHVAMWLCKCSCENHTQKIISGNDLKTGHSKSCGCLNSELTIQRNKERRKYNRYKETSDGIIGYTDNGKSFLIDKEDYEICKEYYWRPNKKGYMETIVYGKKSPLQKRSRGQRLFLHRLVTNCPNGMVVDHIDHDVSNNKKENLRIVTQSENTMNSRLRSDSTTKIKGVYKRKDCDRYEVHIYKHGKDYYLGLYDTIDEAIKVREASEKELFAEYAYDKSKDKTYKTN